MKFTPMKASDLPAEVWLKKTKNQILADAFIQSGAECGKVDGWEHKSASSAASILNTSFKRYGYPQIKAINHDGVVYLVRKDVLENV